MDCNARIGSDAMGRIAIDPIHGFGRVVVSADVVHELSLEIGENFANYLRLLFYRFLVKQIVFERTS